MRILTENPVLMTAFIVGICTLVVYLEQRSKFVQAMSGMTLALVLGLLCTSIGILPTWHSVYGGLFDYILPLSVSLFLFKADLRKIWRVSGRLALVFLMTCAFTLLGGFVIAYVLSGSVAQVAHSASIVVGAYTGGVPNFFALKDLTQIADENWNKLLVSDTAWLYLGIIIIFAVPSLNWFANRFQRVYPSSGHGAGSHLDELRAGSIERDSSRPSEDLDDASVFSTVNTSVTLQNVIFILLIALGIFGTSVWINGSIASITNSPILIQLFSEKLVVIPLITTFLATVFPGFFGKIVGEDTIAVFFAYMFIFATGALISFNDILSMNPLFFMISLTIFAFNFVGTFLFGRLLKIPFEELTLSVAASFLGQYASFAIAKQHGWQKYAMPGVMIGLLGVVLGNYIGLFLFNVLTANGIGQ